MTPSGAFAETAVEAPAQANGLPLYGGHGLNFADYTGRPPTRRSSSVLS